MERYRAGEPIRQQNRILCAVQPLKSYQAFAISDIPIATHIPIIINERPKIPSILSERQERDHSQLFRISPHHDRSTVIGNPDSKKLIFYINGRPFSQYTWKGNEQRSFEVKHQDNEEFGLRYEGLAYVTDSQAERLGKVTTFCEAHGIKSERITQLYEFKQLPDPRGDGLGKITVGEYKKLLVFLYGEQFPPLEAALTMTHFVTWERALLTPQRIYDFTFPHSIKEFNARFASVVDVVNQVEKEPNALSRRVIHKKTPYEYFTQYLAREAGLNFGKLHNSGLVAVYCNASNMTMAAEFCDLEDVQGAPLGYLHRVMDEDDFKHDLKEYFNSPLVGMFDTLNFIQQIYFKKYPQQMPELFQKNFYAAYQEAREAL